MVVETSDRMVAKSSDRIVAESSDRMVAKSSDGMVAETSDRRVVETRDRMVAESSDGRVAETCDRSEDKGESLVVGDVNMAGDRESEAFGMLWEEVGAGVICLEEMSDLNKSTRIGSEYADDGTAARLKGKMPAAAKPVMTFV